MSLNINSFGFTATILEELVFQFFYNGLTAAANTYTGGAVYQMDAGSESAELLTQPLNLTTWTPINGNATINNATQFTTTGGGSGPYILCLTIGKVYQVRVEGFGLDTSVRETNLSATVPLGSLNETITFVATMTRLYIRRGSAGVTTVSSVTLKEIVYPKLITGGVNVPAIPEARYDGSTIHLTNADGSLIFPKKSVYVTDSAGERYLGAWKGKTILPARTNFLTQSNTFSHGNWTKFNSTITASAGIGPRGATSASKLSETAVNNVHYIIQTVGGVTAGNSVALSIYAKPAERKVIGLQLNTTSSADVVRTVVDLNTEAIILPPTILGGGGGISIPNCSVSVEGLDNGWKRVTLVVALTTSSAGSFIVFPCQDNGTASYLGVLGNGIFISEAQMEVGNYETTIIPTTTAAITRAATVDSYLNTSRIRDYNQAIYGEVIPKVRSQQQFIFSTYTDANNEVYLGTSPTILQFVKRVSSNSYIVNLDYIHIANTPFQYQIFWTDAGMGIRVRHKLRGFWQVWSDWSTNSNVNLSPLASTFQLGSRNGAGQFAGNYPWVSTLYLPFLNSIEEYQACIENTLEWNILT